MKSFLEILQEDIGTYELDDLIFNLENEAIIEAVDKYRAQFSDKEKQVRDINNQIEVCVKAQDYEMAAKLKKVRDDL